MRIGMNLIPLRPGQSGGAEIYARDLLAELLKRGEHEYVLVTADYNHATLPEDSARCRRVLFAREGGHAMGGLRRMLPLLDQRLRRGIGRLQERARRRVPAAVRPLLRPLVRSVTSVLEGVRSRLRGRHQRGRAESLRDLIHRERLDLWFCPFTNLEPRICPVPAVITVHDLQHEYYPEFFHPDELLHRRHFYPESCAAADHVIAVSEFTRRCIVDKYGIDPDAVTAIWEGAGSDFDWQAAPVRAAEIRQTYALSPPYVLYPANTWHHKNHRRLIAAVARYRDLHGEAPLLVLTGAGKEGQASLDATVAERGLACRVRMLGYVPRADMPSLYAGAACLVFPSLFEGFGIPLVEAMLAGCPIAAANVTSIPELVGDAGVLFDPLDPDDICRALATILRDPERAADLRRRGRVRAQRFSAAQMAARTLEVFERVARERRERGRRSAHELITVEGLYGDRWMGRETMLALAGRGLVSVEIEGELPGIPSLLPQDLLVTVGEGPAHAVSLTAPGPFGVSVPLPRRGTSPGVWELSLKTSRTFCPMAHGLSADSRDLSLRLLRVRARTEDGREIVKTLDTPASNA